MMWCRGVVLAGIAAFIGLAALAYAEAASAQEVRVTLSGVEARPGKILVALQTQSQFMVGAGAYGAAVDPPAPGEDLVVVFPEVAPGDYAMSAMHDEDGNYDMRRDARGMPLEGWAMSHGGALTGPPTFDQQKFSVGAAPVEVSETMSYPYASPQ